MADIKLRTKEELLLPDYNYYIFFKIEPNEKDVAKIEKSILLERNKWTQGQPIQRRYKELYPDVENVMIKDLGYDPKTNSYSVSGARATELANAKKIKLGEAVRLITSMAGNKGRLYKSELIQIVSSEKIQWFTIADLENEVKDLTKQGIRYIDDTQSVIDFRKYKEVEKYLITVKKASLYEVIEGKPTDSVADLSKCISTVYANLKNKTTPEGTATDKLLGIAKITRRLCFTRVAASSHTLRPILPALPVRLSATSYTSTSSLFIPPLIRPLIRLLPRSPKPIIPIFITNLISDKKNFINKL